MDHISSGHLDKRERGRRINYDFPLSQVTSLRLLVLPMRRRQLVSPLRPKMMRMRMMRMRMTMTMMMRTRPLPFEETKVCNYVPSI